MEKELYNSTFDTYGYTKLKSNRKYSGPTNEWDAKYDGKWLSGSEVSYSIIPLIVY